MKRFIISLFLIFATWQAAFAMSYERAREEALYLTDKMAYELNLNDQQYNDAYEINLDYFLSLDSEADLYADYLSYRLSDLRHILYDWQYNLMLAADYFIRPVYWRAGGWYFPIYAHYTVGHFYYSYPTVYYNYRGGHGRFYHNAGFYASRRPHWNGGFRGHDRGPISHHGSIHHSDRPSHRPDMHRPSSHRGDSRMGSRSTYQDSRSRGGSSYGHPSSTRSTVGHSGSRPSTHSSHSSGFGGASHSSSRGGSVSGASHGATRSSSFGGASHSGSRGSSFSGASHGSSRGSSRGR